MTTANLSLGLDTSAALAKLQAFKGVMQKEFGAVKFGIDTSSLKSDIAKGIGTTEHKLKIDGRHLAGQISAAFEKAFGETYRIKFAGGELTAQIKAAVAAGTAGATLGVGGGAAAGGFDHAAMSQMKLVLTSLLGPAVDDLSKAAAALGSTARQMGALGGTGGAVKASQRYSMPGEDGSRIGIARQLTGAEGHLTAAIEAHKLNTAEAATLAAQKAGMSTSQALMNQRLKEVGTAETLAGKETLLQGQRQLATSQALMNQRLKEVGTAETLAGKETLLQGQRQLATNQALMNQRLKEVGTAETLAAKDALQAGQRQLSTGQSLMNQRLTEIGRIEAAAKAEAQAARNLAADTVRARATFAARADYTNTGARIAGAAALVGHEGDVAARARLGSDSYLVDQIRHLEDHRKSTVSASAATRQHAADMRSAHSAARGLASGFNAMWLTYGQVAPLLAGFALASGFKMAVEGFAQVQYHMQFVKSLSEEAGASVQGLTRQMHAVSVSMGVAPEEAAKGLRGLTQAGLSTQQAMQVLPDIFKLATVGELSVASAAISATGIMNAFGLSVGEVSRIGDVLAKAGAMSATSVSSITESMKVASVVAKQYGVELEVAGVLLTALGKRNITGTAAGTSAKNLITEVYSPSSKKARDAMTELGVNAYDKKTGDRRALLDVIEDYRAAFGKYTPQAQGRLQRDLFGEKGDKEFGSLMEMTSKQIQDLLATLKGSSGFTSSVFRDLQNTTVGQFNLLKSTVLNTLSEIGDQGQGPLTTLMRTIREGFESQRVKSDLTALVQNITALGTAAVYVLPPVVALWGVMKTSALATAGVVAVGSGLGLMGGAATAATSTFGKFIQMVLGVNPIIRLITIIGTLAAGYLLLSERKQSLAEKAGEEIKGINDVTAALEKENEQRKAKLIYESQGKSKQQYDLEQQRASAASAAGAQDKYVDDLQAKLTAALSSGPIARRGGYTAANLASVRAQGDIPGLVSELATARKVQADRADSVARLDRASREASDISAKEQKAAADARKLAEVPSLGRGKKGYDPEKTSTGAEHRDALAAIRFRKEMFDDMARLEDAEFAADEVRLRARHSVGLITDEGFAVRQEGLAIAHMNRMRVIVEDGRTEIEKALTPNIKGTWEEFRRKLEEGTKAGVDPKKIAQGALSANAGTIGFTAADALTQVREIQNAIDKVTQQGVKLDSTVDAARLRVEGNAKKLKQGYEEDLFKAAEHQFEGLAKMDRRLKELNIGSSNGVGPGATDAMFGKDFLGGRATAFQRQEESRRRFQDGILQRQLKGAQKLGGHGAKETALHDEMAAYDEAQPLVRKYAEQIERLNGALEEQARKLATLKSMRPDAKVGLELSATESEMAGTNAELVLARAAKSSAEAGRDSYARGVGERSAKAYDEQRTMSAGWDSFWKNYTAAATDSAKLVDNVMSQSFSSMEQGLLKFVTTGKLNFKSFASSVIADAVRMMAQQEIRKLLGMASSFVMSLFNPTGTTGDFARMDRIPVGSANGNVMTPYGAAPLNSYAAGGVATSPQLSVFGEGRKPEAYVPLQDGRSIPVTVAGGGGGDTNVSVQVFMDGKGGSRVESDTSADKAGQLGDLIQAVVTSTIAKEKRPGGLLYPA